MRYKKTIKTIVVLALTVCLTVGCAADRQIGRQTNGETGKNQASDAEDVQSTREEPTVGIVESGSDTYYIFPDLYTSDKNIYSWNTEVQYNDVSYQIESIEFTQQLGGREKDDVNYLTDEIDEEGNLLNDNYFAWIKLKFKNLSQKKQELFLNFPFASIIQEDGKNRVLDFVAEAVYISPRQASISELAFQYYLEAGEEQEVELGYEINMDTVEGNLCYLIGNAGSELEDTRNCFLDVEEFWDAK